MLVIINIEKILLEVLTKIKLGDISIETLEYIETFEFTDIKEAEKELTAILNSNDNFKYPLSLKKTHIVI